jgi:hypothetical protein
MRTRILQRLNWQGETCRLFLSFPHQLEITVLTILRRCLRIWEKWAEGVKKGIETALCQIITGMDWDK